MEELKSLNANLQIVVAFRMLPKAVWEMPELGTFNLHASLLPNYRGAAPINWAIINGETKTGVTTFFIDEKIDTGAIILKAETAIGPQENAGSLHDRLIDLGSEAVLETLRLIESDAISTIVQIETDDIKTAYKLNKENCKINLSKPAPAIYNLIRGLSPYPGAWCYFRDGGQEYSIKIYDGEIISEVHNNAIGTILSTKKDLMIAISGGFLKVNNLQFPGKKKMTAAELLNGMSFSENAFAS